MRNLFLCFVVLFQVKSYSTECIAHRGFSSIALENSMDAIQKAVEINSDGVEFDVHHTKDGIPIVMHDSFLFRTVESKPGHSCPRFTQIKHLEFSEIKEKCRLKNQEEVPSLEEVMHYLASIDIKKVVEFKDRPNELTLDIIKATISSDTDNLRIIAFDLGDLKYVRDFAEIDPYWNDIKMLHNRSSVNFSYDFGLNLNKKSLHKVNEETLKHGEVGVWTVDREVVMERALEKRLDFITTNRPDLCLSVST